MLSINNEPASLLECFVGIPRLTKVMAAFFLVLHIVYWCIPKSAISLFAVRPGTTFSSGSFMLAIFTAGFFETSLIALLVESILFLLLGKYFEPIWGSKEFFKSILVVNWSISIAVLVISMVIYGLTLDDSILFRHYWCGIAANISLLLVGLKQLIPEEEFTIMNTASCKVKHIPFILGCFQVLLATFLEGVYPAAPFWILGLYFGWFYLRFLQRKPGSGGSTVVGDLNDAFSFASFFPEVMQPLISTLVNPIYRLFVRLQFFSLLGVSVARTVDGTSYGFSIAGSSASLTDSLEAEQRRARAALVLEQRIAQTTPVAKSAPQLSISSKSNNDKGDQNESATSGASQQSSSLSKDSTPRT
eukprot:TRINITY_DN9652_c0_g1_i1.p1 TRINITY_DN9652_c0_g1~~TRINITY_DN9652_c0_g1_i1.p1  ORF type:complete len:360 (-),score=32.65 TRINITY_DN9652_c0_g1_i1:16-1095(-)